MKLLAKLCYFAKKSLEFLSMPMNLDSSPARTKKIEQSHDPLQNSKIKIDYLSYSPSVNQS